ncbi:aminoglycoside phosphotransferase family protein [Ancylothrix sp. C2]|uniref:aminoglycoside phosphotransferase family protein n=1 Tax=Ancylothrix sp. D3o TaxID=2953691 RepID=UPI0021BA89A2|nr:aminoglycoside phosphotransferase family protein [Ancylothrix sp. D3o]MCT7953458.1 aminoglycoside phosphotransferase family protein [Ancylothrix sp. D3o]
MSSQQIPGIDTPASEIEIDASLVQSLLTSQHPDLAHLPLHLVDAGWDNLIFRLGEQLSVRLPRRQLAATFIEHEQIWLPQLPTLPIPIPLPCRLGLPGQGYPWKWSVVPWLSGVTADRQELNHEQAQRFAAFLKALHTPAPPNSPSNQFRGLPLHHQVALFAERMQRLQQAQTFWQFVSTLISPAIEQVWKQALDAPMDVEPTWIHGDLYPRNVLVENGVITGVIDWGNITVGDPATDLAAIWMLFSEPQARQKVALEYNASKLTLQRAKGWAIYFGVLLLGMGLIDNPQYATIGQKILQRIGEDASLFTE